MSRLTVLLDGKPAYLYRFNQSGYELRRQHLCAHHECFTEKQVAERIARIIGQLPEELENYDYLEPDLFERALALAGFVDVETEILLGVWAPELSSHVIERAQLERVLGEKINPKSKPKSKVRR